MTQLEKSVFGAGFVAMTEEELYEVNGGRLGREGCVRDNKESSGETSGSGTGSTETTKITIVDVHVKTPFIEVDYHKETVEKTETKPVSSENTGTKKIGPKEWRNDRM